MKAMRRIRKSVHLLAITFLLLGITSCSEDSDDAPPPSSSFQLLLLDGSWRVASFIDEGVDETGELNGYFFTFSNNGQVRANNPSTGRVVTGTWRTMNDDGRTELILNFGKLNGEVFYELSEDWIKLEQTGTRILLGYDDPQDNYELIFERN